MIISKSRSGGCLQKFSKAHFYHVAVKRRLFLDSFRIRERLTVNQTKDHQHDGR
jgi:hypothetical protein